MTVPIGIDSLTTEQILREVTGTPSAESIAKTKREQSGEGFISTRHAMDMASIHMNDQKGKRR